MHDLVEPSLHTAKFSYLLTLFNQDQKYGFHFEFIIRFKIRNVYFHNMIVF